jgi:hypothetical protein
MDGSNEGGRTKGHAGPGPGGAADGRADQAAPGQDLAALARDWIELWQSEVAALASDPETAETWSRLAALWAGAAASGIAAMPRGAQWGARDERHAPFPGPWPSSWPPFGPTPWATEAPRPAAAAAAPDAGRDAPRRDPGGDVGGDDARLLQRVLDRLDAIEQRLADMERAAQERTGLEQRGRSRTRKADPGQPRRRGR